MEIKNNFMPSIDRSSLVFLSDLALNNNRPWFDANKNRYEAARENIAAWADEVHRLLSRTDVLETPSGKKSLFRIYRDVRFSKNKAPYKTNISGQFVREGKLRRGGYYFSFSPTELVVGGGFYDIEKEDLKRIREEIAFDGARLRSIMRDPAFVATYGQMLGEQLKTAPQGYPKDHPEIELLRYKQFYAMRNFSLEEVLSESFAQQAADAFLCLRPFFDYFTEILTTDANGEPLVGS